MTISQRYARTSTTSETRAAIYDEPPPFFSRAHICFDRPSRYLPTLDYHVSVALEHVLR